MFTKYLFSKNYTQIGHNLFLGGVFLLPSAFSLGSLLLLISLIISYFHSDKNIFKDNWNIPIIISFSLILISTFFVTFISPPDELENYPKSLIWVSLFNWLPILYGFWGFQNYLNTDQKRNNFIRALIFGSIPVILSCIFQFFGIYGPFSTMWGLIIWFQRVPAGGISGLFSNSNYASFWLSINLPFALFLLKSNDKYIKKIVIFLIISLITSFIILSNSRNGLFGLIFVFIAFYGFRKISFLGILGLIFGICLNSILNLINNDLSISTWISSNPHTSVSKLINLDFDLLSSSRFRIWDSAIELIKKRPLLGWGSSTFPHLNQYKSTNIDNFIDAQHTHSMPLELAHNFGIPLSLLIICTIFVLIFNSIKKLKENKYIFKDYLRNKTWLISCLLVLAFHSNDITYYDGKISLLICILFAGLKCIADS